MAPALIDLLIRPFRGAQGPPGGSGPTRDLPLRAELFSTAQLESHALLLAAGHDAVDQPGPELLLHRLDENARRIEEAYRHLAAAAAKGRSVAPAAEWLLDNYYLIEEQTEIARDHLPSGYSRELPRLRSGQDRGVPRVYDLALELVAHTDGRVDIDNLSIFIAAYQRIKPLRLGELWAVPIMLRLAMIENLRRVAQRVSAARADRDVALEWVTRFLRIIQENPRNLITELADFVRADLPLTKPLISEMATHLQGQHASLGLVVNWLDHQLAEQGQSIDQIVQAESQEQAADQISIGNSITSLRHLSAHDWRAFVERQSIAESILRTDPAQTYAAMDFTSRDRYRHRIEHLARYSRSTELAVAQQVVHLAQQAQQNHGPASKAAHIGYYLFDRGQAVLEDRVGYRPPVRIGLQRLLERHALAWYLLAVTLVLAGLAAILAPEITAPFPRGPGALAALAIVLLIALSRPAMFLVNWVLTLALPPRSLPRMDFERAVPPEFLTLVAVPTILTSLAGVKDLLEALQVRYLSNRQANLRFGLLTDFTDADREHLPDDAALLQAARDGIEELNRTHAHSRDAAAADLFFLFHRPRRWNDRERRWMGYERKRGKLNDLNRLILTGDRSAFETIAGGLEGLKDTRFVITLDTDTQLPPGSAWRLVGTLAHPLHRPVLDPRDHHVVEGYGVLQPRVAISFHAATGSRYARLHAGEVGLDPYTREVSNVYHDLFARSQFIGKGIYDLRAFDAAVGNRFPENTILSHDLIEGAFARCGFVDDVELIEDHPSRYIADVARRQRWVRGDWQVLPWISPRVPGPDGKRIRNPLGLLERWLLLDNLRRSLIPPMLLGALIAGWLAPIHSAASYTAVLLLLWFAPDICRAALALAQKPPRLTWRPHLRHVGTCELRQLAINLLELATLPYIAVRNLRSIAKVYWRRLVRRRMLEWQTAHDVERAARLGLARMLWEMKANWIIALAVLALVALLDPAADPVVATFAAAFLAAPLFVWHLSLPFRPRLPQFSPQQIALLRRLARRTWAYFEDFVNAAAHWLPPDNFQEIPSPRTAERTSPTNIGMALLSTLAARDFGYIPASRMLERITNAFATMEKLERYRGHFFNWYSTRDAQPLHPRYISTVDSGNLSAHLLTLRGGLEELRSQPILPPRWKDALRDTTSLVLEEMAPKDTSPPESPQKHDEARRLLRQMLDRLDSVPLHLSATARALADFDNLIHEVTPLIPADTEAAYWLSALTRQCADFRAELAFLAPWLESAATGLDQPTPPPPASPPPPLSALLDTIPTLSALAALPNALAADGAAAKSATGLPPTVQSAVTQGAARAAERLSAIADLAQRAAELADADFAFLYDEERKILLIGYHLDGHTFDSGGYDLLASEARLVSFLAVAQGKLPPEHWFLLGRHIAPGPGPLSLVSWSGSMFEYLMPLLVMPTYTDTLLDRAMRGAILRQIRYGRQRNVPWGITESCYNQVDRDRTYQYRAFGVPDLGLKRGLAEDLVIAPYAAAMALMLLPEKAAANLQRIAALGFVGRYGLYESIDYTKSRVPADQDRVIVQAFMAHHSGMSLLSFAYLMLGQPMQRRLLRDPEIRASTLLLQERIPVVNPFEHHTVRLPEKAHTPEEAARAEAVMRVFSREDLHNPIPDLHLLSNSRYSVMVTASGSGFSHWQDLAVTRWREDVAHEAWGTFIYLQDVDNGRTWSATFEPLQRRFDRYEAVFSQARAEFHSAFHQVESTLEMTVSPEDDIELRRLAIHNRSGRTRTIEVTTYSEVVLLQPRAEASHPALHNLFIQTEMLSPHRAILATRRPRSAQESPPWAFHMLVGRDDSAAEASFETDRLRFLGRNGTTANPAALQHPGALSNTSGAVLDPIFAVRRRVSIKPGASVRFDMVTGVAATREQALMLVDRYHDARFADRVFDLAWTHSQVLLHHLRATQVQAAIFTTLAASILYNNPRFRANPSLIARNHKGQSSLWSYGISGDLPILLVRVTDRAGLDLVRTAIQAHAYWRQKGLRTDLVIWTDAYAGYRQNLLDEIVAMVNSSTESKVLDQPGGIFVRSSDQVPDDDRVLLQAVARVILSDRAGTLEEQVTRRGRLTRLLPPVRPARQVAPLRAELEPVKRDLVFFNGLGGFTPDGREYVILLQPGTHTPAPWCNVLANAQFGTVITEYGSAYTWFENAHELRLTPWHNDPVTDSCGEAFYVRDEETGHLWSPLPGPVRGPGPYVCRHGLGYSVWEHLEQGIFTETWIYVATDASVKFCSIRIHNRSNRTRRISITGYCGWVLGELRDSAAPHVVSVLDPQTGALFASNAFNHDFAGRVGFFHCTEPDRSYTSDRLEFLGRHGSPARPEALGRERLSNKVGAGMDPCAAIQTTIELPPDQQREIVFLLGAGQNEDQARSIVQRFMSADGARQALEAVWEMWKRLLGGVYVETPDPGVNFLVNNWLIYQVLACRFWGRSGYYQSGGAFGFRDQLQDAMALLHECPWLLREHLLLAATRQFRAGDVQHWWHPPAGRGVRTHFSDDYLWLPLALARYVSGTGDTGILDELRPFLEGRTLRPDEESSYELPAITDERAPLYDHAVRAIRHGMRTGPHGLPLMGCGDWNDGMNRVGIEGKGESVWLAFFLYHVLQEFLPIAQARGDNAFADESARFADHLRSAIEAHAWDGRWYRRAYFDDGTPLGSRENPECQIDSLPQSWAVISAAAPPERAAQAMDSVFERLVDKNLHLIRLFTPPFDRAPWDPGYIKGYAPGVRENGGQYTHAAIWYAIACAAMPGEANARRAWDLANMLNPIHHSNTPESAMTYRVEPYAIAADLYTLTGHQGQGGWTWYTGSAAWMYRLFVESLLGITLHVDRLHVHPLLPEGWRGFTVHYRFRETTYHIEVAVVEGAAPGARHITRLTLDDAELDPPDIPLADDRRDHQVRIELSSQPVTSIV